ncbi:MAG: MgtC/SapB family protein [Candidatus Izemoplasma sp.]|jgi:putative Mg2+ transporter-C (MgtC) family protein
MPEAIDTLYILKALGFTILFVGLIGFERQKKNKIAGLTTHILVALGAAGVTIMQEQLYYDSIQLALDFPELAGSIMFERQRIVAQVVTGVGFLGTGAIIKTNGYISGLTTASTLWIGAIIGIIFGYGETTLGIIVSLLALATLTIIKNVFWHLLEDNH